MGVGRYFGRKLKFMVNVPQWMALDELKFHGRNVYHIARSAFTPQQPERHESFEEAVARMHLTEQDIKKRQQYFFWMSMCYLAVALVLGAYVVYLLWHHHIVAAMLATLLTLLTLALMYRESFYQMQMKRRKLGCTFKDWLNQFKLR